MRAWLVACVCVGCGSTPHAGADAPVSPPGIDASPGTPDAPTRPAAGAYLLHDTFDASATGTAPGAPWTLTVPTAGAVWVQGIPFPNDKSAEISKSDTSSTASLSATFAPQSGRVVFQAKVLAAETAGWKAIPYIYDAAGNAVASVAFQDGSLETWIGGTRTIVQPFAANVWYRVRVVVDTDAGVFDLFVDGVRKEHAASLRAAASAVARLAFTMDGANTGTLRVDDVEVYTEAGFIGAPPAPVFDARTYGAKGDGTTNDTAALQAAIDAAAGSDGSVVLAGGTFLSGTLTLKSHMTFYVASSAVLLGSANAADYPTQAPVTGNTQLSNCQRALLYAPNTTALVIDGGGTIDGQGDSFSGVEATRPILLWAVLSDHLAVQNVFLRKGAVWSLVSMESDHVRIADVDVQSNGITHDGIDVVDGSDITVDDVAVSSGDDAMCPKTGVRRGIDGLVVRHSVFRGDQGGSNGIKMGTATYGAFKNVTFEEDLVKDVQYAAMAVESRQGADVSALAFDRIVFSGVGAAFFVYLAQDGTTHPAGDVPKMGSIDGVSFTDVAGATASWPHSPHQGSLITGQIFGGTTYSIANLAFTRVAVSFDGGLATVPGAPPEPMAGQYPESNMFGDLPAWAYYLRHVRGVTFDSCTSAVAAGDARGALVTADVTGLTGAP
jgi:polygalacturonase